MISVISGGPSARWSVARGPLVFLRRTTDYWRRTSYYYGERGKEE